MMNLAAYDPPCTPQKQDTAPAVNYSEIRTAHWARDTKTVVK